MAPKTKTVELSTLSFRSVFKLAREKCNECDIGVQYVISIILAGLNSGSSYHSLNGKYHTLRRYSDLVLKVAPKT